MFTSCWVINSNLFQQDNLHHMSKHSHGESGDLSQERKPQLISHAPSGSYSFVLILFVPRILYSLILKVKTVGYREKSTCKGFSFKQKSLHVTVWGIMFSPELYIYDWCLILGNKHEKYYLHSFCHTYIQRYYTTS